MERKRRERRTGGVCVLCIIIINAHINSIEEFSCPKFNRIELHGRLDNFMQTLTLRFQDLCAYDGNKCTIPIFTILSMHIPNSNTFQRHCVLSIACPTIQSDLCILCILEKLSTFIVYAYWMVVFFSPLFVRLLGIKSEMKTRIWCSQCIWHSILSQGKSLNSIYIWNKRICSKSVAASIPIVHHLVGAPNTKLYRFRFV